MSMKNAALLNSVLRRSCTASRATLVEPRGAIAGPPMAEAESIPPPPEPIAWGGALEVGGAELVVEEAPGKLGVMPSGKE